MPSPRPPRSTPPSLPNPSLIPLSQKLTSTSSLLLERSRVLSLSLPPSASSQNQIVRNLTAIKTELDKWGVQQNKEETETETELEVQLREMGEQYDRLLDVFGEDEVGREKGKALRREKRQPTPELPPPSNPSRASSSTSRSASASASPTPKPSYSTLIPSASPFDDPPPRPTSGAGGGSWNVNRNMPYRDDDDDEAISGTRGSTSGHGKGKGQWKGSDEAHEEGAEAEASERELMDGQQMLMEDQDHRLNILSQSIGRQNHLSIQIGTELDEHHELLEDVDGAMDRTAIRLGRARRRLDQVAEDAKQHGSLITIVVLIIILLLLIIVFKT